MVRLGFEPWHFRPTEWAYHHFTLLLLQMFAFQGLDKLVQGRNLDVTTSGASEAGTMDAGIIFFHLQSIG